MSSDGDGPPDDTRERVRFYLLDHRTPLGKAVDIGLLVLNLVFIGVFVAQTYPIDSAIRARLWDLEVAIASVFVVEYVLRLYGARDRLSEVTNPYTVVDLLSVLPTVLVVLYPVPAVVVNVGFLRVLRVIRVLRFYRFTRDEDFFFRVGLGRRAPGDQALADGVGRPVRFRGAVLHRRSPRQSERRTLR
jgi:voltage-gated potassium channel